MSQEELMNAIAEIEREIAMLPNDGYLFGNEEIYNPWSVINYVSKKDIPQAYWVNTGKNEILADVLQAATEKIKGQLYDLLQGECVITRIDQNVVYRALAENPDNSFSLLLVTGYLKTPKKELQPDGSYLCEESVGNEQQWRRPIIGWSPPHFSGCACSWTLCIRSAPIHTASGCPPAGHPVS